MALQDFAVKSERDAVAARAARLRAWMAEHHLDAVLVPRVDAWRGEWVAPRDERLAWLTGFTGSAGIAVLTAEQGAVFVDGRYRVQIKHETDEAVFTPRRAPEDRLSDWLDQVLSAPARIGIDPWLTTARERKRWQDALPEGVALVELAENPIDAIRDRLPPDPPQRLEVWPLAMAGSSAEDKRADIGAALTALGAEHALITAADSLAWLLNLRGHRIARAPLVHGFALLAASGAMQLWLPEEPSEEVRAHLGPSVALVTLAALQEALSAPGGPVLVSLDEAPLALTQLLERSGRSLPGQDPCALPKACKNPVEIAGARDAHGRDARAMARFLAGVDAAFAAGETLTEIDLVRRLEAERRADPQLRDISFETIAGAGPNGAIVHYRVNEQSNRRLSPGDIVLIDSGGQYPQGTTDITRTIATGAVPDEAAHAYTLVLKGLIAVLTARFPKGVTGRDIDPLARAALWRQGWDYDHGTGHGVGAYLGVHEGPQRISRRDETVFAPGMILSVEPGYYREGAWGIRIENLVVVCEAPSENGRAMLGFENLTYVPLDRGLILVNSLSPDELEWINAYHADCARMALPDLKDNAADWVRAATAPLSRD